MTKKIFTIAMAVLTLGLMSCSTDPEDACDKHVYGADESPYLRTDANATITLNAEFRKGHISDKVIYLKDHAEQIQAKMKMTVDDMLAGLETGKVVFCNINTARGIWNKAAATKGSSGWWYNNAGGVDTAEKGVASIELDKAQKALILSMPKESVAGVTTSANIGFAIDNGKDYDEYIRFSVNFAVTDPGTIVQSITVGAGDYNSYEFKLESCESAINACFGMTLSEFLSEISDTQNDIAMYLVDDNGNWDTGSSYTAGGIGYWVDVNYKVCSWSGDGYAAGNFFFIETHAEDKSIGIGRAPAVPSGSTAKIHFVYASKSDNSKYMEFVLNTTFE